MGKIRGMLSFEELEKLVEAEEIETVVVGFTDHFGRMMGKRFDAEFFVAKLFHLIKTERLHAFF